MDRIQVLKDVISLLESAEMDTLITDAASQAPASKSTASSGSPGVAPGAQAVAPGAQAVAPGAAAAAAQGAVVRR